VANAVFAYSLNAAKCSHYSISQHFSAIFKKRTKENFIRDFKLQKKKIDRMNLHIMLTTRYMLETDQKCK